MSLAGKKIVLVSSWAQNIGNAFFSVSGRWLIEQAAPGAHVTWFQDQPGYRTFHDQSKGNPENHANLIAALDVDYVVLQGPMLTSTFRALWEPTFRVLRDRGTRIILLSAGLFRYTPEEIGAARSFLADYPPAMLATRDSVTFGHVADLCDLAYNGIESAFCIPDAYQPPRFDQPPTVAVGFDRYPEPDFAVGSPPETLSSTSLTGSFDFSGETWSWSYPRIPLFFSRRGQGVAYIGSLADRRRMPNSVGGLEIVRPEHRTNPFIGWKVYRRPGAVASDEPYTYLATYANAELTLSDRVHACVVALAYGRPAVLFGTTPRDALFERMGVTDVRNRPALLPEERRASERDGLIEFLRRGFASLETPGAGS